MDAMLKLLSWNIQSARAPDGGADLDGVLACIERFAPGADLLCLQEVACGFPARDGSPGGDQFAGLGRGPPRAPAPPPQRRAPHAPAGGEPARR